MARSNLAVTGDLAERSAEAEKSLVKELAQAQTKTAFLVLTELMENARSETVRRQAAADVLAWGWGRPSMQVGAQYGDAGAPLVVNIKIGDTERRLEIPVQGTTVGSFTQLPEGD